MNNPLNSDLSASSPLDLQTVNHSQIEEGTIHHIGSANQKFPKLLNDLQKSYKSTQNLKPPQLIHSILQLQPKYVPDEIASEQSGIPFVKQSISCAANTIENHQKIERKKQTHTKSIQSTPVKQVAGENKDDSGQSFEKVQRINYLVTQKRKLNNQDYEQPCLEIVNLLPLLLTKDNCKLLYMISQYLDTISVIRLFQSSKIFRTRTWKLRSYKILRKKIVCGLFQKSTSLNQSSELYQFWDFELDFDRLNVFYPKLFNKLVLKNTTELGAIQKDIERTMQEHTFFHTEFNKNKLKNILVALSQVIPKVGYVEKQNIKNTLAVLLLIGLNEQKSFWLIYYMMKKLNLQSIYYPSFQKLKFLNFATAVHLRIFYPELSSYFVLHQLKQCFIKLDKEIDISYFTTRWFLTLFSYDLPRQMLIKFWNLILMGKWKVLIKMSVALLSFRQYDILLEKLEMDEINDILKNTLLETLECSESTQIQILKLQRKLIITNRLLRSLQSVYDGIFLKQNKLQAKSTVVPCLEENVGLFRDHKTNKLEWRISNVMQDSGRSLAGSINDLIDSLSSSEKSARISEEKDSNYSNKQHFLEKLFPENIKKENKSITHIKNTNTVANEEKQNLKINGTQRENAPQLIQYQQNLNNEQQNKSKPGAFLPFTIPKCSNGDQEFPFNIDDTQSQNSRMNEQRQQKKQIQHDENQYLISHESIPQNYNNFIVNQSKIHN